MNLSYSKAKISPGTELDFQIEEGGILKVSLYESRCFEIEVNDKIKKKQTCFLA